MKQHDLRPPRGARHTRKRIGRGDSSGHGSFSGRGLKGQKSRSGGGVRIGFEGGQNPLMRSLPRIRGFTNIFREEPWVVNVGSLDVFPEDSEITPKTMAEMGIVKNLKRPVKVLGKGELNRRLVVEASSFSAAARKKIEVAGGSVRETK